MTRCHNYADALRHYIRAGSLDLSADELRQLASSSIEKVRLRVAENCRTPADVLSHLAKDKSPDVRLAVALNSAAPKSLLTRLARDEDPTVRYGIAEDVNVPLQVLQSLALDPNPYVAVRAQKTLDMHRDRKISRALRGKRFLRMIQESASPADLQYA